MQTIQKKRGLFSVILPFLIYYAVSMVIQMAATVILMIPKMPEMNQMEPAEDMMATYQKMMEIYMPQMVEEYLKYLPVVTTVVALCVIPAFMLLYKSDIKYEKMIGIPEREKAPVWRYAVIIGIAIPLAIASTNILTLSKITVYSKSYQETGIQLYQAGLGLKLLGYGLIVPVAEELMFRGLIYKRLLFMGDKRRAVLFSAVLFGMYHGNMVQGIYGFVVGYVAVYLYDKYGSIKAPILLHAVMNIAAVIGTQYDLFTWIFRDAVRVAVVTVLCAAVGSSMFVLMQRMFHNPIEDEKDTSFV